MTILKFIKSNKRFRSETGMTLIEIVTAMGLMGVLMFVMLTMQSNQMKSNNFLEFQLKKTQLQNALVGQVFSNPANCACLFETANPFPTTPAAPGATLTGTNPTQIGRYNFVTAGVCATATVPQPLVNAAGVDGLQATSIRLTNIMNASGNYSGTVVVTVRTQKQVLGPSEIPISIPVNVGVTPAGANVDFVNCSSTGSGVSGASVDPNDPACIVMDSCPGFSNQPFNCPANFVMVGLSARWDAWNWRRESCWGAGDSDEPHRRIRCCPLR